MRYSPLHRLHEQSGALIQDHCGWAVPAHYKDTQAEAARMRESAGLVDCSYLDKMELQGRAIATTAANPPAGCPVWKLTSTRALLTCEPTQRHAVESWLASLPPHTVYLTDMTSVFADFVLAGPHSRDILAKLTSLNTGKLANLACAQASVAHANCIVMRQDRSGIPTFHLLPVRDYAESVWESILHAGHEFHLAPCGFRALEALH